MSIEKEEHEKHQKKEQENENEKEQGKREKLKDRIQKLFEKNDFDYIVKKISGIQEFEVNRWGSCQYARALMVFTTLNKLLFEENENEKENSKINKMMEIGKIMNIKIELGKEIESNKAIDNLKIKLNKENLMMNEDNSDQKATDEKRIQQIQNFDQSLVYMRQVSKDLWTSVPIVFAAIYPHASFSPLNAKGNIGLKKHTNNYVGICCWILIYLNYVNSESSFANFDT